MFSNLFDYSKDDYWKDHVNRVKKQLDRIYEDIKRLLLPVQQHQGYFKTQLKREEAARKAKEQAKRQDAECLEKLQAEAAQQAQYLAEKQEVERSAKLQEELDLLAYKMIEYNARRYPNRERIEYEDALLAVMMNHPETCEEMHAPPELTVEEIKEQEEMAAAWAKSWAECAPLREARDKERREQMEKQKAEKQDPEPEYIYWNNGPSM